MNKLKTISFILLMLLGIYFLGPVSPHPELSDTFPSIRLSGEKLENYIDEQEKQYEIRSNNQARIIWANDSTKERTEYVLLYLHGFSASWFEGHPVSENFAKRFGCNAYFARLAEHGIVSDDPLLYMTPDALYESSKEALAIASRLGKKVIIMGTSTGCTLSLMLSAKFPKKVAAQILYSPNIEINQPGAKLLSRPWGMQIAQLANGGSMRELNGIQNECQYWYCDYRMEAVCYLQQLLDNSMNEETFGKVTCPTFVGYYYKDEEHQDPTVKVSAIQRMFKQLGTKDALKWERNFPKAGTHVIPSKLKSKDWEHVQAETFRFAEQVLKLSVN